MEQLIKRLKACDTASLIGIDGMCAAGKTTLANLLAKELSCPVVHMDDFYVPMSQRFEGWQHSPEGNADYGRIIHEVILPFKAGGSFAYRPFDCKSQSPQEAVTVSSPKILIIEGTYSCHPQLREYYDHRVFLSVSPELRRQRLLDRGGKNALKSFTDLWIPMEQLYFDAYAPHACCDTVLFDLMEG